VKVAELICGIKSLRTHLNAKYEEIPLSSMRGVLFWRKIPCYYLTYEGKFIFKRRK
jgi:hypothetical protein